MDYGGSDTDSANSDMMEDEENFAVGTIDNEDYVVSIVANSTGTPWLARAEAAKPRRAPDVHDESGTQKLLDVNSDTRPYTGDWSHILTTISPANTQEASAAEDPAPLESILQLLSSLTATGTSTTQGTVTGTPVPALAPVKTKSPKATPKCTPTPTHSLAPTASTIISY